MTFSTEYCQVAGHLLPFLLTQVSASIKAHLPSFSLLNSLLLDNERWKQADVPAEFQDLVDSIADGKIALPEKKTAGMCSLLHCPLY